MGYLGFDLVYELQVELGWEKEFAVAARKEYMRYLELRVKAQDFHTCKLTPSRVIAIVWSLHRQWTADYENTCSALGGFIHHYPPVMRMGFASERTYAATVELYKSHFNESPPDSYWGAPICAKSASSTDYLSSLHMPPNADMPSHAHGRTRRRSPTAAAAVAVRSSVPSADPVMSAVQHPQVHHPEANAAAIKPETKPVKQKKITRVSRVQQGYVLRPLPPGEKRKRGRPSMSEYIPVSQASEYMPEIMATVPAVEAQAKSPGSGAVSVPGRGSAAIVKSRRLHENNKNHGAVLEAQDINGQTVGEATGSATAAAVMMKRPRGRPRKDTSWAVARGPSEATAVPIKPKIELAHAPTDIHMTTSVPEAAAMTTTIPQSSEPMHSIPVPAEGAVHPPQAAAEGAVGVVVKEDEAKFA
ncbi:hypothetical protein BWQ96_00375 [Gracilariopsis chorda]|uniref:Uncharacterized protein n=1 Tax=Gracilariopsis chorda TaxID=448386 RepID=A0A2V3J5Y6_9FLOR|nr:hypothetical protein BWQ96_00375 [Gracilariopsis chorda]|eukprot:PXF49723.1 hypothetical protein BWQ96_00375 [Gracilariopsis chorda]